MYYTKILKITSGGARNLLPLAYERPVPNTRTKGLKTGNFCKKRYFLGNFYTTYDRTRPQIFGIFTLPAQKSPTKITGNFL